jgi:hypothetical protein
MFKTLDAKNPIKYRKSVPTPLINFTAPRPPYQKLFEKIPPGFSIREYL